MTWLLQTKAYQDGNPEKIEQILKNNNINYSWVQCVPFTNEFTTVKPSAKWHRLAPHYEEHEFSYNSPYFFYGTINRFKSVGSEPNWCNFDLLRWRNYAYRYKNYLLNSATIRMTTQDIFEFKEKLFINMGFPHSIFIRPDDNEKSFDGEVVCFDKIEEWYHDTYKWNGNKRIRAVVSKVKPIEQEWRVVVSKGKFITGSQYRFNGSVELEEGCPEEVKYLAEHLFQQWAPHPIFTMDVCLSEGKFKLVEIGSIHTCGLYECNLEKFVLAVEENLNDYGSNRS